MLFPSALMAPSCSTPCRSQLTPEVSPSWPPSMPPSFSIHRRVSRRLEPSSRDPCLQGYAGADLFYRLYNSFGYLKTEGFNGHKFAVLVGEIGSKFTADIDLQSLADVAAWFQAKPNTGAAHSPIQASAALNRLALACAQCRHPAEPCKIVQMRPFQVQVDQSINYSRHRPAVPGRHGCLVPSQAQHWGSILPCSGRRSGTVTVVAFSV